MYLMLTGFAGAYARPSIESMAAFILANAFFYTRKLWQVVWETLLIKHIVSLAEMREPYKMLEKSGREPVAILHGSLLVGYFMPAVAISNETHRGAALEEVAGSLVSRNAITRPVLDYLMDK